MNTRILQLLFVFVFTCFNGIQISVFAQKAPIKYGKINRADLEMKAYPLDTSASAAILCDYGYFNSTEFQFVRTLRVKIFKKEGTSWGNQIFPTSSRTDIKGITFNIENGEIVESKLKSESIFHEFVNDNYSRTRVAMPNVKEGSIIDLEFRFEGLPFEWRFQDEIPVSWSELIIEPSAFVMFHKNFYGFELLSESTNKRSVGKNMPAFKKEPFMNSPKNYITKFEIELLKISFPPNGSNTTGFYRDFTTTWKAVNTRLEENPQFGKAMIGCYFLNDIAKDIEEKYSGPFERLKAAHEAIKKAVKWNEIESVTSKTDKLSNAFNKKIGNSGDINLMLIQLLKKLGFEVYPVVLSTRENGFLSPLSPSLTKLNYVVAYVLLDEKKIFLDATEEFLPVGMLPPRCINIQGRLIDENKMDWVNLIPDKKERKFIQLDLKLQPDNILNGKMTTTNYDYAAFDYRKKYERFNSKEEYLEDLERTHKGLNIINCEITNLDSIYLPLKESSEVKLKNFVTSVGSMLYINPLLFEQMTSNPFKTEERKYPVDFIYPSERIYQFKLELPEGAEVAELPKPLSMKLSDGSAAVQYQITTAGKFVQLTYKFMVDKPIYSEKEYGDLRALFSELIKKHSEQIVIKTL